MTVDLDLADVVASLAYPDDGGPPFLLLAAGDVQVRLLVGERVGEAAQEARRLSDTAGALAVGLRRRLIDG